MHENLSEKQSEQLARQIYKAAQMRGTIAGFVFALVFPLVSITLLICLGVSHSSVLMGGAIGFSSIGIMVFPNLFGMRTLRHAGLLREEKEIVQRIGVAPKGETVEFYYPMGFWGKIGLLSIFVVMGFGSLWLWQFRFSDPFVVVFAIAGIIFALGFGLLFLLTFNQPNARLNDKGVLGYYRGLWPRLVFWESIETAHFESVSGIPATDFRHEKPLESVSLKGKAGKTLLTLESVSFAGAAPEIRERFFAELKRRLSQSD